MWHGRPSGAIRQRRELAHLNVIDRLFDPSLMEQALAWDMPAFLQTYTLHDSVLEEVRHSPRGGIAVVIDWDLHWNPAIPPSYRTLALVFPIPYSFIWTQGSWHYATLDGATSEVVPAADRERMLSDGSMEVRAFQNHPDEISPCAFDDSLTRTVFQGINWSRITILHNSGVRLFCFDDAGTWFAIPKVVPEFGTAPDRGSK
jgi:hypothetical protein